MTMKNDNLTLVLRTLIAERPEYATINVPADLENQRLLMRSLCNVREPLPVTPEFLKAQDAELQAQTRAKGIVDLSEIMSTGSDRRLRLWQGDITRLKVDAIVNAANSTLLGCFVPLHRCIDNAIHSAAGVQLRMECHRLMQAQGHPEPTGRAKITDAYNLPSEKIIHTVGPIVSNGIPTERQERELASCYRSSLELADSHGLRSIAFCCISTGEFGFPRRRAAEIAVTTVREYLNDTPSTGILAVIFNVFKDEDLSIYRSILP